MQKIGLIFLISGVLFSGSFVLAQIDEFSATLDETIEDLGTGEPNILPDSPFYFLKQWSRTIQNVFAFTTVAKAQLKEKFSGEKLLEVKKMVEQNKSQEQIENAVRNYQEEIGEMQRATEKIRETATESEGVGKFLDKFIQQQTLHQRVLQKIEEQVPEETFEKIQAAREEHLERFAEVMTRLEDKANIQERLEKNLQEVKGSEFKEFKNLEILKELEEKVPEEAKEAVRNAGENTLLRLKTGVEKLPLQTQERFSEYIERIGGQKETQLEIIEDLKEKIEETPSLRQNLIQTKERILEGIEEWKLEEGELKEGEESKEDEIAEEGQKRACIQVWKPVCGKNGKTYSNECFAESAGAEIAYEGACKKPTTETPTRIQLRESNQ